MESKIIIQKVILGVLLTTVFSFGVKASITSAADFNIPPNARTLKSASEFDYPPFALVRPDGSADGFSVELLQTVVHEMGMEIDIPIGPWHEIKQKLADGLLEVLPLVSYSRDRDRFYDFTAPYLQSRGTVFVRKGEKTIHSESDLQDKEVLVMRADAAHEYAVSKNLSAKLVLTESYEEAFTLLAAGRHDAILCQYLMGLQLMKKLSIANVISVPSEQKLNMKPHGKATGFEQKFCFAVREGDKKLLADLNEGLAIVIASGTYDQLYNKWFGPILPAVPASPIKIAKYLLITLVPILLFGTLIGIWLLRKEVARKTKNLSEEIIERQQAEEQSEQLRKFNELILSAAGEGIYGVDTEGKTTFANPIAAKMIGWEPEELIGLNQHKVLHHSKNDGSPYPAEECPIYAALKDGGIHRIDNEVFWRKDGSSFPVEYTSTPIKNDRGNIEGAVVVFRDNTDRKHAEEALRQAHNQLEQRVAERTQELQKTHVQLLHAEKLSAIGQLSASIAHEFNNPLFGIMNVLNGINRRGSLSEENGKMVEMALKECNRMKNLIKDLQDFNRPTSGIAAIMDIHSCLDSILLLSKKEYGVRNISIVKKYGENIPVITAVADQIKQVLLNLLNNAADACAGVENATITIKTALTGKEKITIQIQDTGKGIKPEHIEKIFDPFFTTKSEVKGTGLGLSISFGIIKNHGGRIDVENEEGRGATFTVTLPIKAS